jgi:hypothetical protein
MVVHQNLIETLEKIEVREKYKARIINAGENLAVILLTSS